MAIDDNYKVGPFQRIIDLSFASGFRLYYSPVCGDVSNESNVQDTGWEAPFWSGDPPVEINPPFGTDQTYNDADNDHDNRHKIASQDGVSEFGVQHDDSGTLAMPGNCYWEDGSNVCSWWGCQGMGSPTNSVQRANKHHANQYERGIQPGDILYTWTALENNRMVVITERKTAGAPPYLATWPSIAQIGTYFYYQHLPDISNCIWVNGTKYSVPVTSGSYGSLILGACTKNGYIIYSELGVSYTGSSDEKVRWYKMSDGTNGTLFTIDVNNSYSSGQIGIWNVNATFFNKSCTKLLTFKVNNYTTSQGKKINGTITWSGGAPSGGSDSMTDKSYFPSYYGWNDDTEVYVHNISSGSYLVYVTHCVPKHDFVFAYEVENSSNLYKGGYYFSVSYIIIQYNGWCRAYPVDYETGTCDFSSYVSVPGGDIKNWQGTGNNGYSSQTINPAGGSCVVTSSKAFISMGNGLCGQQEPNTKGLVNYSIMIESDGTVTDLGTQLLDNTVSGNDFNSRLMTLQA